MVVLVAQSLLYVLPFYTAVDFLLPAQPFSQPEAKPSAFGFKLGIDIMVVMIAKSLLYVPPLYTAVDFLLPAQPFSQPEAKPSAFCFKLTIQRYC
jgi:hypothetical protein